MRIKVGVSACLIGEKCNFNGQDLFSAFVSTLRQNPHVELLPFCPENSVFGTPRPNLRIVGGDGFDVLESRARVLDENDHDVTAKQIEGATRFLETLQQSNIEIAILMDGSPSCGSNVLLREENWPHGGFKKGIGVTAALLKMNRFKILSSFDEKSVNRFLHELLPEIELNPSLRDLKDNPKFAPLFLA